MRQTLFIIFILTFIGVKSNCQDIYGKWRVTNYTIIDTSKINFDSVGLLYLETMYLKDIRYISISKTDKQIIFEPIDPRGVRFAFYIFLNEKTKLITIDSTKADNNCERYKYRFLSKKDLELINQYGNTIKLKKK